MTIDAHSDDWHRYVGYQIYPRSFADSNADGIGDLPGVLRHVDHLERLGVDFVWMSPVYRSPMDDNGYDISDYYDIDPSFGTLSDLDNLVEALHSRGIRLMMDLVVNHSSDEHPWFLASRSSREDPKRDWYYWRGPRPGCGGGRPGSEPNNWASRFSGSAWEWDETTEQYYLHLFSKKQPDLNWENPDLRAEVYSMMRWWLDRGVDGFRMDVISMLSKHPDMPDVAPAPGSLYGPGDRYYLSRPRTHEFIQEMNREVFASRPGHVLSVGETPRVTVEDAALFCDPDRGELDMVFSFEHVMVDFAAHRYDRIPLELPRLKAVMASWQEGCGGKVWNSLYLGNHDQPRSLSRFGDDGEHRVASAKTLATVLHLHRGTPYVYQGEEIGMANAPFASIDDFRDVEVLNFYAIEKAKGDTDIEALEDAMFERSRDQGRTPMQWDSSPAGGFSTTQPWIMVNPDFSEINVAAQSEDPDSVMSHYIRLIELRHADPVVTDGDFTLLLEEHPNLWCFTRTSSDGQLLVAANFSAVVEHAEIPVDDGWSKATVVISNMADPPRGGPSVTLRAWESVVWRR